MSMSTEPSSQSVKYFVRAWKIITKRFCTIKGSPGRAIRVIMTDTYRVIEREAHVRFRIDSVPSLNVYRVHV